MMQKNLRFYILVTHTLHKVKRHFSYTGILPKEAIVVINTTNDVFYKQCSNWCDSKGIPWIRTESDGTPATGKNSVLDLFLNSKDDYMVAIDGDDYLTKYGYAYYKNIVKQNNPPDSLCLYKQQSQLITIFGQRIWINLMGLPTDLDTEMHIRRTHLMGEVYAHHLKDYYENKYGDLELYVKDCLKHTKENLYYVYKYYERYNIYENEFAESHCRPVLFSKAAAKECHFPSNVPVGEDTLVYLQLKNAHFQGRIQTQLVDELNGGITYLYDCIKSDGDELGAMLGITLNQTDYTWVRLINIKLKEMEQKGELHAVPLPVNNCLPSKWEKDNLIPAKPQFPFDFDLQKWDEQWKDKGVFHEAPSKEAMEIIENIRMCENYYSTESAVVLQNIEQQKENKKELLKALGVSPNAMVKFPKGYFNNSRPYFHHATPHEVAQHYPKS